jgi:hypothetical protein
MATPQDIIYNAGSTTVTVATTPPTVETTSSLLTEELTPPTAPTTSTSVAGMIRNISQTVQEREIIKTCPDVVVFIDGLPYMINVYVNDPRTGNQSTLVNFNDHVVSFSASYDVDSLVPNCTIGLQVPNYQKYLYQQPGGNNLLQTMAQIQVYAKGYYLAAGTGDTVYRRVFKGVTSYIGYNDNGKTLEISIQCQGILYLFEKMQTNIHPSASTATHTGAQLTTFQSIYASGNCFEILQQVFNDALRSDGFQFGNLWNQSMGGYSSSGVNPFWQAVRKGYMAKWQAILTNMTKDVHIYGPNKDNLGDNVCLKKGQKWGEKDKNTQSAAVSKYSTQNEATISEQNATYYGNIAVYLPFKNIVAMDLKNDVIVNRLDLIREVVAMMDFEAYQDIDGKIIIKPPIYNLDVTNLGTRTSQTQTNPNSPHNSLTNPATQIYETNNPFVVYLSEILTEQENEDQAAIRRTRTTVCGNICRGLVIQGAADVANYVGEYIDVTKLAKFGLREEPLYMVPWIANGGGQTTLFAHAAAETARANRGYRTYTFTIPMRPELKLGFPVYIPHKDMYAYIKSISLSFDIGGTATMTVTCDSVRRRVLVNTLQTSGSGNSQQTFSAYTPAPNLVYQWTQTTTNSSTLPSQSPSSAVVTTQQAALLNAGTISGVSNTNTNPSNPVGVSQTLPTPIKSPDGSSFQPTPSALSVYSVQSSILASHTGNQFDTPTSTYVIKNDGNAQQGTIDPATGHGYFCKDQAHSQSRSADLAYIKTLCGDVLTHADSVIPFTDDKGYELIAPFPWGRWVSLNKALKEFTEKGWVQPPTDVNGNDTLQDLQTLQNTDAFLFAGLGTPSATNDPSSQLVSVLNQQNRLVGGSLTGTYSVAPLPAASTTTTNVSAQQTAGSGTNSPTQYASQTNSTQPDATVIILHYDPSQAGSFADRNLLNAAQPENAFAQQLLASTQNAAQQLVDVLVSGNVSPSPTVQEELLVANTPVVQSRYTGQAGVQLPLYQSTPGNG